jgi:sphinganine-1-phosphate aldolase
MPGSSRLPVSLRDTFNARKSSAKGQLVALNIEVYVASLLCLVCRSHTTDQVQRIRNIVFVLFLLRWTRKLFYQLKGRGIFGSLGDLYINLRRYLYGVFLRLPGVRTKVQTQVSESLLKLERKLVPSGPGVERITCLPSAGWSEEEVRKKLDDLANMEHTKWEDGRVSGAVYHGGDELIRLQTEAFGKFTVSNPIHPDVFPGVRKMEAEIVAMVGHFTASRCCSNKLTKRRCCPCSALLKAQWALPPLGGPNPF